MLQLNIFEGQSESFVTFFYNKDTMDFCTKQNGWTKLMEMEQFQEHTKFIGFDSLSY